MRQTGRRRAILISALVIVISFSYYFTFFQYVYYPEYVYFHVLFRDLYFLPLILAGIWFGLNGALLASSVITVLYIPFIIINWQGMSPVDFNRILEIALFNAVGAVLGVVSDREKARERALRESENLATMGSALSAVAHDMRNPLTAIAGFARLLEEHSAMDDADRRKLRFIIQGTDRLEAMVRDMLDFSRPLHLNVAKEDMNQAVRDCATMLDNKAKEKHLNILEALSADLPLVTMDCVRMQQVFLNLMTNAIEASPDSEAIEIRTRVEDGWAQFEVVDHGTGIRREDRKKIFAPFFTTKRQGTGLGLAIVLKVVEAHGGRVEVPEVEHGATFRIVLPLRD